MFGHFPWDKDLVLDSRCNRLIRHMGDERGQMIAQTSAFLSWALSEGQSLPRIPRRRVDEGGFSELLRRPGARAAAEHWWNRILDRIGVMVV